MHSPHNWRTSSYSGDRNNCVEVAELPGRATVRDSTRPHRLHLTFQATEWQAFLTSLHYGEL